MKNKGKRHKCDFSSWDFLHFQTIQKKIFPFCLVPCRLYIRKGYHLLDSVISERTPDVSVHLDGIQEQQAFPNKSDLRKRCFPQDLNWGSMGIMALFQCPLRVSSVHGGNFLISLVFFLYRKSNFCLVLKYHMII